MSIIFVSVAVISVAITVSAVVITRKLKKISNYVNTERIVNELLREHITKLESKVLDLKEKSAVLESVKSTKPYWKRKKKQETAEVLVPTKKRGRKKSSEGSLI